MESKSILVIDDSRDMLDLQRVILEGAGFKVFTAQTAAAALETLSEIEDPTLIILDQQMEDMSGVEFLEILEEKKPEISEKVPVVILSGAEPFECSKAVGFIQKFPDIDVFLEKVHQFITAGVERNIQNFRNSEIQNNL